MSGISGSENRKFSVDPVEALSGTVDKAQSHKSVELKIPLA